ncbi:sorting nexin-11 isoform X2 [Triplophysa rosa]|uniref:Sorting nexin-11 n=2 Tax=Triplophysa rosa TaxID=992332 RepID=A0A9W7TET5_TRIRA|nr:sorting nexin-11 isoform X2 [Triplophysa rosa]KAI7797335.1 sorting nexin-11 [Triplophysa rosa]
MIKSQEQDEFIAVRVQDPRLQNEGSWNSYVDFKIFLHTNSKAFTAKTSCVRRRYSEFVWLKKKLQKNAGLVPVPDLPKKSFFSFINDDFIERRRKGLQSFLDKLLHMTVCLSDSQLHLFLQTQLPIKHIEDCVQGHTPYTVTEAILTYATSNRGWAQEEGVGVQELWTAPVTYESTESPAPHLPTSSRFEPPREVTDASDLETVLILSETEQAGSGLKEESDPEHMIQEKESTINLVVDAESGKSKKTQRLDGKDLQRDGHEYHVPQTDEPRGDLYCLDKAEREIYAGSDIERRTLDGTSEEKKGHQKVALEQCDRIGKDLVKAEDQTSEDVALDGTYVSEENIPDAKHQEHSEAEITEESEISDEEKVNETSRTHSEINETRLSHSECSEDDIGEVNEINAKSVHAGSAVLILEGIEEALVTETVQNVDTYDDRNLDANTADVSTLVLQAIEVASVQCQEKDCHMIISSQQPDAK